MVTLMFWFKWQVRVNVSTTSCLLISQLGGREAVVHMAIVAMVTVTETDNTV